METCLIPDGSGYIGSRWAKRLAATKRFARMVAAGCGKRLVLCRPGGIYGTVDPRSILRMIRAVKRGYLVFPGSRDLKKSSRPDPEVGFLWNFKFGP